MALTPGTKLGPYEIQSPLGAGGMGEVYRARDTRLERTVAIKVLADRLSSPQDKERFQREARVVSSLSHPHICALYDVGQHEGYDFLVMEYLEGETLADRLQKGSLPTRQVLELGMQMAEALAAAHRAGVVHRDLKPGNIMLTRSGIKLLDFGLAKPNVTTAVPDTLTVSKPLTTEGTIVGTYQYMAPEQVEGKDADARTDIFALGAVLYEMATGRRAFEGKSRVSIMSAILEKDPEPMSAVQRLTPPALEHVVRLSLAKDAEQRWQSAGDVARELKWIAEAESSIAAALPLARSKSPAILKWTVAIVLLACASVVGYLLRAPRPELPIWSNLNLGGDPSEEGTFALAPDGLKLAYVASTPQGKFVLWMRSLDSLTAQPLEGTDGAEYPFWSPDGKNVGFFADGKLKRIEATGRGLQTLCDAPSGRGGTWNRDGVIVFPPNANGGLARVSAAGGSPSNLTKPKVATDSDRWPHFLPDGRHFLFTLAYSTTGEDGIYVGSLDSPEIRLVSARVKANAAYAAGYLISVRDGKLMAEPFDARRLRPAGDAVLLGEGVRWAFDRRIADFSAVGGALVYLPSASTGQRLVWFDRAGKQLGVALSDIGHPSTGVFAGTLAPDGARVAISRIRGDAADIWIYDLKTGLGSRLTFSDGLNEVPVWSPDGSRVIFTRNLLDHSDLRFKSVSGAGDEQVLVSSSQNAYVSSWSRDGNYVAYTADIFAPSGKVQVRAVPTRGEHKSFQAVQSGGNAADGYFSPDGKWLAYDSDESGRLEMYATPFPGHESKWQLSTGGGSQPIWVGNGNETEVLFQDAQLHLISVPVHIRGTTLTTGAPRELLNGRSLGNARFLDVTRDGQRILLGIPQENASTQLTLVQNWTAVPKR